MNVSKTSLSYWEKRIRQRTYKASDGTIKTISNFSLKLSEGSRAVWFDCLSAEKRLARERAREIGVYFIAHGLAETIKRYKDRPEVEKTCNLTVSQYISSVEHLSMFSPDTLQLYRRSLYRIVSGVFGIKDLDKRNNRIPLMDREWIKKVGSVKLARLTPAKVQAWLNHFVSQRNGEMSAKRSANAYLRNAKGLLGRTVTKKLQKLGQIEIPPNPFHDVEYFDEGDKKYYSRINIHAIIAAARNELKPKEPEQYKVFLLGLFAAMRREEIDGLEWDMVDFANGIITLRETPYLRCKTANSAAAIGIDPELSEELRLLKAGSTSQFVVTSTAPAREHRQVGTYRCDWIFDRLNEWLRSKGIVDQKPLHTLRKEMGSQIATKDGLYPASVFLRNTTAVTEKHYACLKRRVSTGLGGLLKTEIKVA